MKGLELEALKRLYNYMGFTYRNEDEFIESIKEDFKNWYLAGFEDGYTYFDGDRYCGIKFKTLEILGEDEVEKFEDDQFRKTALQLGRF